jgi:hypothetical protein
MGHCRPVTGLLYLQTFGDDQQRKVNENSMGHCSFADNVCGIGLNFTLKNMSFVL